MEEIMHLSRVNHAEILIGLGPTLAPHDALATDSQHGSLGQKAEGRLIAAFVDSKGQAGAHGEICELRILLP